MNPPRVWVEKIMGMPISLHVRTEPGPRPDLDEAARTMFATLRQFDQVFSTYRVDSDLIRVRRGELPLREAHPWLVRARDLTDEAVAATGGLFATELTGPDGSRGWDPTGLVKGWALERAVDALREIPSVSFCCNGGGDVVCGLGARSEHLRAPWRVGLQDPHDIGSVAGVVEVKTAAVATSGNSARGRHIVDPRTGSFVDRPGSATVSGPSLMWADVWATACFIDPTALQRAVRDGGRRWSAYRSLELP